MKNCLFALILISSNLYSQVKVTHQLEVVKTNKHQYIDLRLNYQNKDTSTYALYLNVWRIVMSQSHDESISGVPYMANMINFVFITPQGYDFKPFFESQGEFQMVERDLYNCRVKKLLPNEKFLIHIIVSDPTTISFIEKGDYQISYIYSTCNFNKIDSLLGHSNEIYYPYEDLVLTDLGMLSEEPIFIYPEKCIKRENIMRQLNEVFEKKYYNIELSNLH